MFIQCEVNLQGNIQPFRQHRTARLYIIQRIQDFYKNTTKIKFLRIRKLRHRKLKHFLLNDVLMWSKDLKSDFDDNEI